MKILRLPIKLSKTLAENRNHTTLHVSPSRVAKILRLSNFTELILQEEKIIVINEHETVEIKLDSIKNISSENLTFIKSIDILLVNGAEYSVEGFSSINLKSFMKIYLDRLKSIEKEKENCPKLKSEKIILAEGDHSKYEKQAQVKTTSFREEIQEEINKKPSEIKEEEDKGRNMRYWKSQFMT